MTIKKGEEMNIYEKLSAIQQELKAPKGQYNSFGKYRYRSAEDILEAVKPICAKNKATLFLSDTVREIGGRIYVQAIAHLADAENPEDTISVSAYAREAETKKGMDASQITGTASSYARKYAMNGLFNIDDTKDADTDEYRHQTRPAIANGRTVQELRDLIKQAGQQEEAVCSKYGVMSIEDLSQDNAALIINKLKKYLGGRK